MVVDPVYGTPGGPATGGVIARRVAFSAAVVIGLPRTVVRFVEGVVKMPRLRDEATTRRRILKAGLVVVGGAVATGPVQAGDNDPTGDRARGQPAPAKFTPEAVHYQATPNDWRKCLYCTYFQAPSTCGIVSGTVSPQGWCNHFALLHE